VLPRGSRESFENPAPVPPTPNPSWVVSPRPKEIKLSGYSLFLLFIFFLSFFFKYIYNSEKTSSTYLQDKAD
jgi:hypothetical protein